MKAVVISFDAIVIGRTREEVLALMDEVGLNTMADIGGAPWVTTSDDVVKEHMPQATISDENGFIYKGHVSLNFGGPHVFTDAKTMHEGFTMQMRAQTDA